MFTRCIVCHAPFAPNRTLEHFPVGRRVAYDPGRGRLWAVCAVCRRWTLAPIEERWEAMEELERTVTDRARLLAQTDNVALLHAGDVEIVRVGRAQLAEEAWWRYGRELLTRRQRYRRLTVAGTVATGAVVIGGLTAGVSVIALWWGANRVPQGFHALARWLRFGSTAWQGRSRCPRCGQVHQEFRFADRERLLLSPGDREEPAVLLPCAHCRFGAHRLEGAEAEHVLRRVLAYHHYSGASERRIRDATRRIEQAGSSTEFRRRLVQRPVALHRLHRSTAIALEIAVNEDAERRMLELELADLEARWREEEELASIMDGELTPVPLLETLRRKVLALTA